MSALGFLLGGQAHAADGPAHPIRLTHPAPARGVTETRTRHGSPQTPTVSVPRTSPGRVQKPGDRTGHDVGDPGPSADSAPLSLSGVDVGAGDAVGAPASPPASPRPRGRTTAHSGRGTSPGSAHPGRAVERRPATEGVERAVPEVVGSVRSVREPVRPVGKTVVRPVAGAAEPSAAGAVVRPLTGTSGRPRGALTEVLGGGLPIPALSDPDTHPTLPTLPTRLGLPALPALPTRPALPVLPALPRTHLPGLPEVPGAALPEVPGPPVLPALPGVDSQDPPRSVTPRAERGAAEEGAAGRAVAVVDGSSLSGPTVVAAWRPALGPGRPGARSGDVGVRRGTDGAGVGPLFGRQAPPGGATGATGSQSALDNATPRHAEVPAVTPSHRAPQPLARGLSTATPVSGTGDRYRDIPVFPG
ncbi:hypothetical protein AB0454_23850 [Streptomyces sp. NPDC093509]|uniref:hypothetical protein n=1 Tax=Streptomyces sp. NPDC093509 TaxID=3154982 RepID=UPI00344F921E